MSEDSEKVTNPSESPRDLQYLGTVRVPVSIIGYSNDHCTGTREPPSTNRSRSNIIQLLHRGGAPVRARDSGALAAMVRRVLAVLVVLGVLEGAIAQHHIDFGNCSCDTFCDVS